MHTEKHKGKSRSYTLWGLGLFALTLVGCQQQKTESHINEPNKVQSKQSLSTSTQYMLGQNEGPSFSVSQSSTDGYISVPAARTLARIQLEQFRATQKWEGATVAELPIVVYDLSQNIKAYEFRVWRDNQDVGIISVNAKKQADRAVYNEVGSHRPDYDLVFADIKAKQRSQKTAKGYRIIDAEPVGFVMEIVWEDANQVQESKYYKPNAEGDQLVTPEEMKLAQQLDQFTNMSYQQKFVWLKAQTAKMEADPNADPAAMAKYRAEIEPNLAAMEQEAIQLDNDATETWKNFEPGVDPLVSATDADILALVQQAEPDQPPQGSLAGLPIEENTLSFDPSNGPNNAIVLKAEMRVNHKYLLPTYVARQGYWLSVKSDGYRRGVGAVYKALRNHNIIGPPWGVSEQYQFNAWEPGIARSLGMNWSNGVTTPQNMADGIYNLSGGKFFALPIDSNYWAGRLIEQGNPVLFRPHAWAVPFVWRVYLGDMQLSYWERVLLEQKAWVAYRHKESSQWATWWAIHLKWETVAATVQWQSRSTTNYTLVHDPACWRCFGLDTWQPYQIDLRGKDGIAVVRNPLAP